jgi:hypothetical protein
MRTFPTFPAFAAGLPVGFRVGLLAGLLAGLLMGGPGCTTDPKVEGPTRLVVGQHVTLQLEQGEAFLDGEFSLTDSEGFEYPAADPLLEYAYLGGKELRFTVPYGIASGVASVSVGAEGRDPYVFDVEIVRLFGTLTTGGALAFADLDAPGREYSDVQVGAGPGFIGLSAAGDQLIAVSRESGVVHFLEVRADELVPFAPSIDLQLPLGRGALMEGGALVAAERGVAFISEQSNGSLVLEQWLDTGPMTSLAAAADTGRAVAVGSTEDASPIDVLRRLNLGTFPPEITPPLIPLGGTPGGVADVAIDPAGELALAVNTPDSKLISVSLTANPVSAQQRDLPEGSEGPTRVVIARRGNYAGVICPGSKTVAIYTVSGGGVAPLGTVAADPRVEQPEQAAEPVDLGFAPAKRMLVLLSDGAVAHVDLEASPPAVTLLRDAQGSAGAALVVQP